MDIESPHPARTPDAIAGIWPAIAFVWLPPRTASTRTPTRTLHALFMVGRRSLHDDARKVHMEQAIANDVKGDRSQQQRTGSTTTSRNRLVKEMFVKSAKDICGRKIKNPQFKVMTTWEGRNGSTSGAPPRLD